MTSLSDMEMHRLIAEYTANDLNQYTDITSQMSQTFQTSYDADGNQTLVKTTTGTWQVAYNGENRPILWTQGTNTISMSFDRMGRRVTKNDQRFVYDGYLQIANFHSPTQTQNSNYYIWDPTEPVATRPLVWNSSTVQPFNSSTFFYTHDGNKNVSEVIATDGTLAAHYEYAPFGAVILKRGERAGTNPWRFSSEYAEDDTTTVYYNYRHYEPVTGRWLRRDPLFEDGGENLNAFVRNRAQNYVDLCGLSIGRPNWFTKGGHTHEELTRDAYPYGKDNPLSCLSDDSILNALIESNVETDSGDTEDQQQYHYCTGLKHWYSWSFNNEKYKKDYSATLAKELDKFKKGIADPNKSNCDEALNALGTLTHMWQDYYSHGVEDDGWFNGDEGAIKGSPDDPQMTPDSFGWYGFRGGHGGLFRLLNPFTRVEPGDRADDSEERRRQAVDFVNKKLLDLLPKWAAQCCCAWGESK